MKWFPVCRQKCDVVNDANVVNASDARCREGDNASYTTSRHQRLKWNGNSFEITKTCDDES